MIKLGRFFLGVKIAAITVFGLLFIMASPNILPYNLRFPLWMFMVFIGLPIVCYIVWQGVVDESEGVPSSTVDEIFGGWWPKEEPDSERRKKVVEEKQYEVGSNEEKKPKNRRRMIR